MRTIMRAAGAALAAFALAAGLTACAATPSPSSDETDTRVVVDAEGTEVRVPNDPQRVITLSEPTLDATLALGVTPIGTVTGRGQSTVPNYLADLAGDIPLLGGIAQPNFEAIGTARPDLILVDGTSINNNPPVIEALRRIAPVVFSGYAGGDWRDNLAIVADALGRPGEGAAIVADYDRRIAEAQDSLAPYADSTFSIVRWQGGSAAVILKELLPGRMLDDLGLKRPAVQDRYGQGHSDPVSLENLRDIDADYMFFGTLGGSSVDNPAAGGDTDVSGAAAALADAEAVPGFRELEAFRNGNVILVDGSVWTSTGGPILMNRLIDDVTEALR